MRVPYLIAALALSGCCWFRSAPLPEPATDRGLAGAESNLDHLTDKRNSRVAAAVTVAKGISTEKAVQSELTVAEAMLPAASKDDLAYAKARADKGDDAFYALQLKTSQELAKAILDADAKYESEKARKQAEYAAALKDKEMALAAEQEARQADKWTYAGIGLVTIGLLAVFLTPMKLAGIGVAVTGFVVGAFPLMSKTSWFLPGIGALLALGALGGVSYLIWSRKASPEPSQTPQNDAQEPPQAQG